MKKSNLVSAWRKFTRSLKKVSKTDNNVDWSKEEIILSRLETKLGKSKEEINHLISKDLMSLLTKVPFSK
ncbi:MAG TPA: hypothetical protein VF691_13490 [Cytophagaceae bacterium]